MDTLSMFLSPGAALGHLDENFSNNDGGRYYDSDGEACQVNHCHVQDGANFGEAGWGKSSGKFIPTNELRGRRIAP